jgi:hypothetical protein
VQISPPPFINIAPRKFYAQGIALPFFLCYKWSRYDCNPDAVSLQEVRLALDDAKGPQAHPLS